MEANPLDQILDKAYKYDVCLIVVAIKHCALETGHNKFGFPVTTLKGLSLEDVTSKVSYLSNAGLLVFEEYLLDFTEVQTSTPSYKEIQRDTLLIEISEEPFNSLYAYCVEYVANHKPHVQIDNPLITVRIKKDGLNLYLQASDGQRIMLNRFRADLTPEKLMDYLLKHSNTLIPLTQLKLEGSGFESTTNVTERLRKAGFTDSIKKHFLPVSDNLRVLLRDEVKMTFAEFDEIKAEFRNKTISE